MATEQGTIIRATEDRAWVQTKRSHACESCASRDACRVLGGVNDMEVEALNSVRAGIGDIVLIRFGSGSLLKATFLLYLFPVLCLLVGAFIGETTASGLDLDPSATAAFGALLGFGLSFLYVRRKGNRMAARKEYQPEIARILRKGGHEEDSEASTP